MPMLPNRPALRRCAARGAVALLGATLLTAGVTACSTMVLDASPAAPTLPPAFVQPLPAPLALHVPVDVARVRVDERIKMTGLDLEVHHALGPALAATVRQVVGQSGNAAPDVADGPPFAPAAFERASTIAVPGVPAIVSRFDDRTVVTILTQRLTLPLSLYRADGTVDLLHVEASVATGAYGPLFTSAKVLDELLLRNLAAAMLVALGATVPHAADDTALHAAPAGGLGVLRLDAGLAQRDGIEARTEQCLRAAFPAPPGASATVLRDALFPWLEPGVVPQTTEGLGVLLAQPAVQQRLATLGVGWLVVFTAHDAPSKKNEHMLCAGGFGAGACFGLWSATSSYTVDMAVWNAATAQPVASVRADVLRTLSAVGLLLPIPFMSSNAAETCAQMQAFVRQSMVRDAGAPVQH
jgi:hypothetical protein